MDQGTWQRLVGNLGKILFENDRNHEEFRTESAKDLKKQRFKDLFMVGHSEVNACTLLPDVCGGWLKDEN